jgi:DNA repair exonuclease SbcCD ATPase subunit
MKKVLSLTVKNFGRFVGEHTIDFNSMPNFFQIGGQNKNTGGSSGAAKSTIPKALEYLFGVNSTPATKLQSRLTKDGILVSAKIQDGPHVYEISRGKSEGLSVAGHDIEISGNNKIAEEWLDKFIGMPRDVFRPTFHRRQDEDGLLLSKTPKEIREFFLKCLGLDTLSEKLEKASALQSSLQLEVSKISNEIAITRASLDSYEDALSGLKEPKRSVDAEILRRQEAKLEKASQDLSAIEKDVLKRPYPDQPVRLIEIDLEIKKINQEKTSKLSEISKKKDLIQTFQKNLNKELSEIDFLQKKIPRIDQDLAEIKKNVEKINNSSCPTCEQHWQDDNSKAESQKIIAKGKSLFEEKKSILDALSKVEAIKSKLAECDSEIANLKLLEEEMAYSQSTTSLYEESKRLSSQYANAKSLIDEEYSNSLAKNQSDLHSIDLEFSPTLNQLAGQLDMEKQVYNKIHTEISYFEKDLESYKENLKRLVDKKTLNLATLSEQEAKLLDKNAKLKIAENSIRFLKSYINQLFTDTLADIADRASKILIQIPNMENASIHFESFKESKNGTIKEEVNPMLSVGEEDSVPIDTISGGERRSVDLAIDLATISLIQEKTGSGIDLFILDEPFNGLDAACRLPCLHALSSHGLDKKIGIMDHNQETKEMITSKIVAVREGQESRIIYE